MGFTLVAGTGIERDQRLIFQVLDCVVPNGEGSYLASPISTGRRYYEALARYGAASLEDLIRVIGEEEYLRQVRWPNVADGEEIAARLRQQGVRHLINTGPIFIREWPNNRYMDLCYELLERKIRTVYLHPEWAFSSGAVKEFFFCFDRKLRILDIDGQSFTLTRTRIDLEAVRQKLNLLQLPTDRVEKQLQRLDELSFAIAGD